jgi:isopentenyl-diphosphate delta-isomerase
MASADKKYPPVVVVDENDNEVGSAMLAEVWQKGLYHRIVSIFVEDDLGRMLLQLRAPNMLLYPNRWDQAAAGHVDEGHSYEQAAIIEVAEETGLRNVQLKTLGTYRYNTTYGERIINQFERVYVARVPHEVALEPQLEEVSKLEWFTPSKLKAQIASHPDEFTPGLLYALHKYYPSVSEQ